MRLVFVTTSLPHGRSEAFLVAEVEALRARGHEVLVVPMRPRGPVLHAGADFADPALVRPLLDPAVLRGAARQAAAAPGRALAAFRFVLGSRNPRIFGKNLAVLPKALWLAGEVQRREADHVHAHWASTSATMGAVAARVAGVEWSFTAHRWDIVEDNLLAAKVASATFVRAISRAGLAEIRQIAGEVAGKVRVIRMGVQVPADPPRPWAPHSPARLLVPANLVEVKGHVWLLRAVARLVEDGVAVHLDVAGDGPLREDLAQEVDVLGIGTHVAFLGVLPHADLQARLAAGDWDVVVLPSIVTPDGAKEGVPVSLIEAMSHGVPVVGTRAGAVPELVEGAGVLVPPADAEALADGIRKLLTDPAEARRLAEAGRRRAVEEYDAGQVAAQIEAAIRGT